MGGVERYIEHADETNDLARTTSLIYSVIDGHKRYVDAMVHRDRPDGTLYWANMHVAQLWAHESPEASHVMVLYADITDLKRVEHELEIAKEMALDSARVRAA